MSRDRIVVNVEGLETTLARLEALPAEVVSKSGGPVKAGLRKGALVIRDEMRRNVQTIVDEPDKDSDTTSTGLLRDSIAVKRGKGHATLKGERYWVMVPKRKRYPTGSGIPVERVGQMLEYGTSKRGPMPWAGPAFHAKKAEAMQVIVSEMNRAISTIERRLARINKE